MKEPFSERQQEILGKMGLCLLLCHEIEFYFSNAYLLGLSSREKRKYQTISNLLGGRKKKTFGNLLQIMEDAYEIEPTFKKGFKLFLWMRNRYIHGITQDDRFSFHTKEGIEELDIFIDAFFELCLSMKKVFRGCYLASLDFANDWVIDKEGIAIVELTEEEKDQVGYFREVFKTKDEQQVT